MNRESLLTLAVVLSIAISCFGESTPDTLVKDGYDQAEMDAAIAQAREKVDSFVAELAKPTGANHSVKAPIQDDGVTEHFWLIDVSYHNGEFKGTINNEPGMVTTVALGQAWTIRRDQISDWMFVRDGKIHGNYTLRPLLKTMPEEQAAKIRSILADP